MPKASAFFAKHGYYHARSVFSMTEIAALETEFDRIVEQLQASGEPIDGTWPDAAMEKIHRKSDVILHTHNVQQYSAAWFRAIQNCTLLDRAEEFLGENLILHHTKLFLKPPGIGSPFPIHQDAPYFPTAKHSMIAAIIHVSDATDAMGCFRLYPGSHKLGPIPQASGRTESEALSDYPLDGAKILEAQAGDVVFFHYFTLHGSMPNRSQRPRKTVLVQLYAGDDWIESGTDHPNEQLVLRGWNYHATRESTGH